MAEPVPLVNRSQNVGRDFCVSRLEKQLLARAVDLALACVAKGWVSKSDGARSPAADAKTIWKGASI